MEIKEEIHTGFLRVSKFQSIKAKILVFALMATIVPALVLGGMSYLQNSKLLREKISNELRNATMQTAKELDLWLKERLYDLRVFSSSYVISENFPRTSGRQRSNIETMVTLDHIKGYLNAVSEKFGIYEALTLVNLKGEVVVTSAADPSNIKIPDLWLERISSTPPIGTKVHFIPYVGEGSMLIAEEISTSSGSPLGVLVAKINLEVVGSILKLRCEGEISEIYLTTAGGKVLVSSKPLPKTGHASAHYFGVSSASPDQSEEPADYIGFRDEAVIGMAMPIAGVDWVMVAEMEKKNAYAEILVLRRLTIALVGGLIFCIGICAYIFGHSVVSPVRRLSKEAASVAAGNLDVDIPVTGLSEVSYLTQVFNHMVASLKQGREEISAANNSLLETNKVLHRLSITDSLTGLYNRNHIMELLDREIARAARYNQPLAVLMLDIDYFKKVNDTYGHQTGDIVMGRLAKSLQESVRECDYAGRYGGEEFLIILPSSNILGGAVIAERIRHNIGSLQIPAGGQNLSVTVSIGVACYPDHGDDVESIVRKADDALYATKANGRNCVSVSGRIESHHPSEGSDSRGPNLKVISRS